MNLAEIKKLIPGLKMDVLAMIHKSGRGYTGSALSCLEILSTLYFADVNGRPVMQYRSEKPGWDERDYVVFSHCPSAASLYVCLAQAGFFSKELLTSFGAENILPSYPCHKIPGVEATIVRLGYGLGVAYGIAMSLKLDKKENRVFAMINSAELQGGEMCEAIMAIGNAKLDNVLVCVDHNRLQADGDISKVMPVEPLVSKFEAFSWRVVQVVNGHDLDEILDAFIKVSKMRRHPVAIIFHTVSAFGIPFAQNKSFYYGSVFSDQELEMASNFLENNDQKTGTKFQTNVNDQFIMS